MRFGGTWREFYNIAKFTLKSNLRGSKNWERQCSQVKAKEREMSDEQHLQHSFVAGEIVEVRTRGEKKFLLFITHATLYENIGFCADIGRKMMK